jgi:hypothetical protein
VNSRRQHRTLSCERKRHCTPNFPLPHCHFAKRSDQIQQRQSPLPTGTAGPDQWCPPGIDPLPKLDNVIAVRDAVEKLISDVYTGKLHPRVAAGLAPLLNLQLRALEADLERRIAKVEKLVARAEAKSSRKEHDERPAHDFDKLALSLATCSITELEFVRAACRRRISLAQKARSAKQKASGHAPKPKRTISAAGRRRIAAAQRARSAKVNRAA